MIDAKHDENTFALLPSPELLSIHTDLSQGGHPWLLRQQKKPASNKPQTTTSPFVIQCPQCWPAGSPPREERFTASRTRDVRKGERGVVRIIPLSPWR
jgi:hypothetical protein